MLIHLLLHRSYSIAFRFLPLLVHSTCVFLFLIHVIINKYRMAFIKISIERLLNKLAYGLTECRLILYLFI